MHLKIKFGSFCEFFFNIVFPGSSAPEILLSVIEIIGNNFQAGIISLFFNKISFYGKNQLDFKF